MTERKTRSRSTSYESGRGGQEWVGYLYDLINDLDPLIYVGITGNLQTRWGHHRAKGRSLTTLGHPLYDHMKRDGIEHYRMVQVGALYTSLKALLMAEIDRIATLRTVEREFGHNLSRGGGGRNSTAKGNDVIEIDESERRTLSQLRDRIEGAIKVGIVTNGVKGEVKTVWLSAGVIEKLAIVLRCMAGPEAVRIRPLNNELTTQEAAEFLGISRPSMVKLLRENALPWSTPTLKKTHRRVKLSDLVAFRDSLADEAAERGEPKLLAGRAAFLAEAEAARTRRQITPR